MLLSFTVFGDGWAIGYMFFSLHLFFLGYLIFRSGYLNYQAVFMVIVMVPAIIGEMGFAIWLLFKGGKVSSRDTDEGNKQDHIDAI